MSIDSGYSSTNLSFACGPTLVQSPTTTTATPSSSLPDTSFRDNNTYSRHFQPRLLGFKGPVHDPTKVISYSPCTGLAYTIWYPQTQKPLAPKNGNAPGPQQEICIDSSCIVVSVAGRQQSETGSLSWGVFHGPGSPRNLSGRMPLRNKTEKTRTQLHAALNAVLEALQQAQKIVEERGEIQNIVVIVDNRRIMHAVISCVHQWKANGWTKAKGKKGVPNAKIWKKIVEKMEELEAPTVNVGIRFWCVQENMNGDAGRLASEELEKEGKFKKIPPPIALPWFPSNAYCNDILSGAASPTSSNWSTTTFSDVFGTPFLTPYEEITPYQMFGGCYSPYWACN